MFDKQGEYTLTFHHGEWHCSWSYFSADIFPPLFISTSNPYIVKALEVCREIVLMHEEDDNDGKRR